MESFGENNNAKQDVVQPVFRCNAAFGEDLLNYGNKENKNSSIKSIWTISVNFIRFVNYNVFVGVTIADLHQMLVENAKNLEYIKKKIDARDEVLSQQTVLLDRITKKIFSSYPEIKIFPIESMDDLSSLDTKLKKYPEEDIVRYIDFIISIHCTIILFILD